MTAMFAAYCGTSLKTTCRLGVPTDIFVLLPVFKQMYVYCQSSIILDFYTSHALLVLEHIGGMERVPLTTAKN